MGYSAGERLGPYEIVARLGAGGMGEVFRARDTRLERSVAIKVLPDHLSGNPELKQRFEREAKAISSLNHPHICTLHDVGSQDGVDFLVMEYLEGETLADRLQKSALRIEEALKIAVEIADALEKAHRQGIVHRDLKPGNVMLTKAGAKLMDFGLAKPAPALGTMQSGHVTPNTPTMSVAALTSPASPLTQKGTIVGTFQYMAPEVLQGAEADARSDIFSFGCLLYEMIAGRRAFEGKSQVSVLAAILDREPEPIRAAQPMTPPALEYCVHTCLAKDPDERYQTAHDVKLQLSWTQQALSAATSSEGVGKPTASRRTVFATIAIAVVIMLAAGLAVWRMWPTMPLMHTFIAPPAGTTFLLTGDFSGPPALSPDGKMLVFEATSSDGKSRLWVRSLDTEAARPLEGVAGGNFPFWSPDSRSIGYFADGKLKKISVSGGAATALADAPNGRGGSWNSNDVILFVPDFRSAIMQVSAHGGTVTPATTLDVALHSTHRWPVFLPDGKHFIFLATNHTGGQRERCGTYLGKLGEPNVRQVNVSDAGPLYTDGYLLFHSGDALMAQRMDGSGKLSGDPTTVVGSVALDASVWRMVATASDTGLLVFRGGTGGGSGGTDLEWFDRTGKSLGKVGPSGYYRDPRLSPDGKTLAFVQGGPAAQNDIYLTDLARGVASRFTFDTASHLQPAWSPDGKKIAYAAVVGNYSVAGWQIYVKDVAGGGAPEVVVPDPGNSAGTNVPEWTPDGRYVLYRLQAGPTGGKVNAMPLAGERKPIPVLSAQSPRGSINNYRISPDGKWIAFECDDSGRQEIYVSKFLGPGGRTQVSNGGGLYPVWRGDGKELYFVDAQTAMIVAVPVKSSASEFQFGTQQPLSRYHASASGNSLYDVTRDGQKFLVNTAPENTAIPLSLITNWTAGLKK